MQDIVVDTPVEKIGTSQMSNGVSDMVKDTILNTSLEEKQSTSPVLPSSKTHTVRTKVDPRLPSGWPQWDIEFVLKPLDQLRGQ